MNFAEYWIRNRVVTLVLAVVTIGGGTLAFESMSRLEDPEFTIKDALVVTPLPRCLGDRGRKGGQRRDRAGGAEARPARTKSSRARPGASPR